MRLFTVAVITFVFGLCASEDVASSCRTSQRQSCNEFQQCCARRCGGGHQSSCTDSNGRISTATCRCDSSSTGTTTGQNIDYTRTCNGLASGSCTRFEHCCRGRCTRPASLSCAGTGTTITRSTCECPPFTTGGGTGQGTGHGTGHGQRTTPASGTGMVGSGGQDYTRTCTRNNRNCLSFRSCCTNNCLSQVEQIACRDSSGNVADTVCKCKAGF